MHVILSVPVPSDIVISPLAIPYSIISSIINVVSPFDLFLAGSLCLFFIASPLLLAAVVLLTVDTKLF
jgi:hypothetical protein